MLIPSYAELMNVLNQESDEKSEITSRYTIVIAAAKRARQIIDGDKPMVKEKKGKPVSTAVDEIYKNKIKIVPEGEGTVLFLDKPEKEISKTKKSEDLSFDSSDENDDINDNEFENNDLIENNNPFDIDEIDEDIF